MSGDCPGSACILLSAFLFTPYPPTMLSHAGVTMPVWIFPYAIHTFQHKLRFAFIFTLIKYSYKQYRLFLISMLFLLELFRTVSKCLWIVHKNWQMFLSFHYQTFKMSPRLYFYRLLFIHNSILKKSE